MKNVSLTITVHTMCLPMQQIHAFHVIAIQKLQMVRVAVLVENVIVNRDSPDLNVWNVHLAIKEKTAPDVHVTKEEPCTVVNVNLIVNVR